MAANKPRRRTVSAFERLRRRIYAEYRRKGYSPARARYVARSTAGEVATRKHRKR